MERRVLDAAEQRRIFNVEGSVKKVEQDCKEAVMEKAVRFFGDRPTKSKTAISDFLQLMEPILIATVASYNADNKQSQQELADYLSQMWLHQLKHVYFSEHGGKVLVEKTAQSFLM